MSELKKEAAQLLEKQGYEHRHINRILVNQVECVTPFDQQRGSRDICITNLTKKIREEMELLNVLVQLQEIERNIYIP